MSKLQVDLILSNLADLCVESETSRNTSSERILMLEVVSETLTPTRMVELKDKPPSLNSNYKVWKIP